MILGVFNRAWQLYKKSLFLIIVLFFIGAVANFLLSSIITRALFDIFWALLDIPILNIPLARLPFYLYGLVPGAFNILFAIGVLSVYIGLLLFVYVTAYAKTIVNNRPSYSTAAKYVFKRAGGIFSLTLLILLLYAVIFSVGIFLLYLVTLFAPFGILGLFLGILAILFAIGLFIYVTVHIFLAVPIFTFEDLPAGKALARASAESRGNGVSIFCIIVGILVIMGIASWIASYLQFDLIRLFVITLFSVYTYLLPTAYLLSKK